LFQVAQAALFVLANQLPDIFAGSTPIAGCYLPFDVVLESLGERGI
jgi:hypothetical protein